MMVRKGILLFMMIGSFLLMVNCGKDDLLELPLIARFESDASFIENGSSVTFTDVSQGNPTEWSWTFEGGEPAFSDQQNPVVTYSTEGRYDVQLLVKSGDRSDLLLKEGHVEVVEQILEIKAIKEVVYGIDQTQHVLDVYLPERATGKTPLIIMMGGGGFYSWSGRDLLVPFANQLVPRGIAVASARYRKVLPPQSPNRYQEGIINSNQDAKAAVRYFRANHEQYQIDPNLIFIGGNSSGAIGSLVAAYYDWDEIPQFEQSIMAKHGGLEGAQGSMTISSDVAGVISLAGEMVAAIDFIDPNDPPFFGVCAADDELVTCDTRFSAGGYQAFGAVPIAARAKEVGLSADAFIFSSGTHETARQRPEEYVDRLMDWITAIIQNPPSFNAEPFIYYESFNEGCLPVGWTSISVQNENYDWECKGDEGGSLYINSFNESGMDQATENWLMTDRLLIEGSSKPTLLFDHTLRFNDEDGYGLQVYASTTVDADKVFNPNDWSPISPVYDQQNVSSLEEDFVNVRLDITEYVGQEIRVAFRYTSTGSIPNKSLEARLDNFRIMK